MANVPGSGTIVNDPVYDPLLIVSVVAPVWVIVPVRVASPVRL